jgi:uncharacterized membrane protein YphA (DoxX/SURF4 family)
MRALPTVRPIQQAVRNRTILPWLATVSRLGLAGVLAWAALPKIANPDAAMLSVRAYQLLPEIAVRPVAWGLPFAELALATLLVAGLGTRVAATAAGVLLTAYIAAIASAWVRGLRIDCGCFSTGGVDPTTTAGRYAAEIGRDLGLLLVTGLLAWHPRSRLALLAEPDARSGQEGS